MNLEQRKGRYPDVFEVVRIASPGFLLLNAALRGFVVFEDGIRIGSGSRRFHGDDVVLDLPRLASYHRRRRRRLHLFPRPRPFPPRPSLLSPPLPVLPLPLQLSTSNTTTSRPSHHLQQKMNLHRQPLPTNLRNLNLSAQNPRFFSVPQSPTGKENWCKREKFLESKPGALELAGSHAAILQLELAL